jgi:hypothetical protein
MMMNSSMYIDNIKIIKEYNEFSHINCGKQRYPLTMHYLSSDGLL